MTARSVAAEFRRMIEGMSSNGKFAGQQGNSTETRHQGRFRHCDAVPHHGARTVRPQRRRLRLPAFCGRGASPSHFLHVHSCVLSLSETSAVDEVPGKVFRPGGPLGSCEREVAGRSPGGDEGFSTEPLGLASRDLTVAATLNKKKRPDLRPASVTKQI